MTNIFYYLLKINIALAAPPAIGTGENPPPAGTTGNNVNFPNPIGAKDLMTLISRIADYMIAIGIGLSIIMVLWGAYQMMFSQGDPKGFQKGTKTIAYTAIGLAVLLLARGLVSVVINLLRKL